MSELKISKTAYSITQSFVTSRLWTKLDDNARALASKPVQQAINSELDRIAGPLAEALAASLNELRRICKEPNWLIGV